MSDVIDISIVVSESTPVWPGSPGAVLRRHMSIDDGADANASELRMDVHCGTHVDAPLHFIRDGGDLEAVGLDPFVGSAYVAHVEWVRIGAAELEASGIPAGTERLLLRTASSGGWGSRPFDPDFPALTIDGARWVVARGIKLVGIDCVSIQRFEDGPETHQVLLGNGVCILEGIELLDVSAGPYDLTCLPLRLAAEAAPARAILRRTQ